VKKVDWTESQLGDDPYDSARYGLYSHFKPAQKSKEVVVREIAETIKDPIERWSYLHVNMPKQADDAPFRQRFTTRWGQEL
jgi:hypothetical protein